MSRETISCENLVIGSGPGGATTALLLARAGKDVILVEEGPHVPPHSIHNYSLQEMDAKYRNGGLTPAFGKTKVVYIEPCCVGGGAEVNAALYHYPLPEVLSDWEKNYQIKGLDGNDLKPFFAENENDVPVSCLPGPLGGISQKIKQGAERLKWENKEIPRCWKYGADNSGTIGRRQSLTATIIPQALAQGCRLLPQTKVHFIEHHGRRAQAALATTIKDGQLSRVKILFQDVFVCGGAIQTPALLRRSGIKKNIGNSLRMHPAVRIVARFNEEINDGNEGVPPVQVQKFKPAVTLGGSCSTIPHLAMWMTSQNNLHGRLKDWRHLGIFYVLTTGYGAGAVRNIPIVNEPFVQLPVLEKDFLALGKGLQQLGRLLFAAGAVEIFPPMEGGTNITHEEGLKIFDQGLPPQAEISTIHLFSSCPMGEDLTKCAVDSYGQLHGHDNIYLNDASILPNTPGVNPQATIMAIARRNIADFLKHHQP